MLRSGVRLVARGGAADDTNKPLLGAPHGPWRGGTGGPWPQPGDFVEIYSNSQQAWYKGKVESREDNMVTVSYDQQGMQATKSLPADHANLRAFKGRVTQWEGTGKGAKKVEPKNKGEGKGRPGGKDSYAADGTHGASDHAGYPTSAGDEHLKVAILEGDPVEVFSNSTQVWCKGYVESIHGNMLTLSYQSPSADGCGMDWTKKTVPSEHNCWRKAYDATGHGMTKAAEFVFDIGDEVEIYSNSNKCWCSGRVTQRKKGSVVTVCFQLPGASPDDYLEKDVKLPSDFLRRAKEEHFAAAAASGASGSTTFTDVEKACYDREFIEVTGGQDHATVVQVADHLAKSQLPRKTLKEVWQVGNPESRDPVNRAEFFLCCRLIGHCQTMAEEPGKSQLLQEGGENLRAILKNEFKRAPPSRLPDFYLNRLMG